ncbi:MAG: GH3 auxin-responsive promoter family protein [Bacteroidetes bacterium]|nr:GH3 auxin-responsive promoter family protein [Bacteroidota bacterium]
MPLFDIQLPNSVARTLRLPTNSPERQQLRVLKRLLRKSRFTDFGKQFQFDEILMSGQVAKKFQELVPIYNYNSMYEQWWKLAQSGFPDICWPGKIKYYALSSGTSESTSKYIPITADLLKGNRMVMIKQLLSLRNYQDLPMRSIGKSWLMIGGSTELEKGPGYYAGDLSGITAKKAPIWFQPFYKPGKKIAKVKDWDQKMEEIVENAPSWDIGFIVGVPAWIQLCMEKIIEKYHLKTIHDIWPNLAFFVHGGVSFEPYKKGFSKYLGKPLIYIETYLASEGFIAYQDRKDAIGMRLVTNEHIFHEFIPFDDRHFDAAGEMLPGIKTLLIHEVEEGKDYALLISTTAGAWRYLIGDTIRFSDLDKCEVVITGRTKHFLSLVGEHLSVDNMNKAIQNLSELLNISIPEFTVAGEKYGDFFAHHWYIACDDQVDAPLIKENLDQQLKSLNDDYGVERKSALKEIFVEILPHEKFLEFLRLKDKVGGQHKFPRVLKGTTLDEWKAYLEK